MKRLLHLITILLSLSHYNGFGIELIQNGNFSIYSGTGQIWQQSGSFYFSPVSGSTCYTSANSYAYLSNPDGSAGNSLNGTLYQTISMPATYANLTLSFYRSIKTTEIGSTGYDFLYVRLRNNSGGLIQTLATYSNSDGSTATCQTYIPITINSLPINLGGQTIRVSFEASTNGTNPTVFRLDDVSLNYTACTNSISAASASATPQISTPGSPVTLSKSGGSLGTGASWFWYTGGCGTNSLGAGSGTNGSLVVYPTVTTTYWVMAVGTCFNPSCNCNNTTCVSTTVTVCTPPTTPSNAYANGSTGTVTVEQGDPLILTQSGGNLGSGSNSTWVWYSGNCGPPASSLNGTGTNGYLDLTGLPQGNYTFFVRGESSCGTPSSCKYVNVDIIPPCNPVAILNQPQSIGPIPQGGSAVFSITLDPSSTPPFTYRWYKNNTSNLVLTESNSYSLTSTFTVTPVSIANNGEQYFCKITNCDGTSPASNYATLTVQCTNTPVTGNPKFVTAYNYFCTNNLVSLNPPAQSSPINRNVLAAMLRRILLPSYASSYSPVINYPTPFLDLENDQIAPDDTLDAMKMMLYLDYNDGISPFQRDFFNTEPNGTFTRGFGLRAILEAFNKAPDWTGYDPNSNSFSSFASDVKLNDPNYGYLKKAISMGWIQTTGTNALGPSDLFTHGDADTIIYSMIAPPNSWPTPPISSTTTNDYFIPNNFTPLNTSSNADLTRGCFSNYSEEGITIARGGMPLNFHPVYNSHLFEIPKGGVWNDSIKIYKDIAYPLGEGWTHNYNIYIYKGSSSASFVNNRYFVNWPDGRIEVYNPTTGSYETKGVKDTFTVDAFNSNYIYITTPNRDKLTFLKVTGNFPLYRLISIDDRNLNKVELSYNTGPNGYSLASIKNSYSNDIIDVYCTVGSRLIDSVGFAGKKIHFKRNNIITDLNGYGDLIKYVNAKNDTTYYTYAGTSNKRHLITKIKLPKGNDIDNTYDSHRKLSQTSNGSYTTSISFSGNYSGTISTTSQITQTSANGTVNSTIQHNIDGVPTSITTVNNSTNITTVYGDNVNPLSPTSVTDNNTGIINTYLYDALGNTTSHSISKSGMTTLTETWVINTTHNKWQQYTDMNGVVTNRTFDANGNVLHVTQSSGANVSGSIDAGTNYNSYGQPTSSNNGYISSNFGYSNKGILNYFSIPALSISSSASHDIYGRYTSVINPNGIKDSAEYDLNDNVTKTIKDPSGLNLVTSHEYDKNDNVTKTIAPKGDQTILTYDFAKDDLLDVLYGSYNQHMTYNADGTLNTLKNKNNYTFTNTYYPASDPRAGILNSDGYKTINVNSTTKRVDNITNSADIISFIYDGFGRPTSITYNDIANNTVGYEYQGTRLSRIIYPLGLGNLDYQYNSNGLLIKALWNNKVMIEYFYRGDLKLVQEKYFNKITKNYYYDNAGRLDSLIYKKANSQTIAGYILQKDAQGNLTKDSSFVKYSNPAVINYSFGGFNTRTYDNMNRCTSYNGEANAFNGNGCMTNFGVINGTYTYDERDNMSSRTVSGNTETMTVDPLENRRKFGDTRYLLDLINNENVLAEANYSNGQVSNIYLYGDLKFCRLPSSTGMPSFYLTDYRGSTIAILDSNENVSHYYYYQNGLQGRLDSSYVSSTLGFANTDLFVGAYGCITHDSSLVYMRARYYNPMIGNFYSEDPEWSTNLFSYANNNSGNIDPDGTNPLLLAGAVIGAVTNETIYFFKTPNPTTKGAFYAMGRGAITGMLYSEGRVKEATFVNAGLDGLENAWNAKSKNEFNSKFLTGFATSYVSSKIFSNAFSPVVSTVGNNYGPVAELTAKIITKKIRSEIVKSWFKTHKAQ